jgi:hypothetical protein
MDMDYSAARVAHEATQEAMKQKWLDSFIKEEEYEDAMNKLPIYEKEVIKDVIQKIKDDNLTDKINKLNRQHTQEIAE